MSSHNSHVFRGNQILSALSCRQYPLLFASLKSVQLNHHTILYNLSGPINSAFFITSGMVSLLAATEDGSTTQVAMVGDEGFVGIPAILRINKAPYQVCVQISGRALRVRTDVLVKEFQRDGPLQDILLRYVNCMTCEIVQSVACNRFHSIEQRLCRWLLAAQYRVRSNELPLTQEMLSLLLGATRTNVTEAAASLKKAGLIRYRHGTIQLMDLRGLEIVTCECYQVIKNEIQAFLSA